MFVDELLLTRSAQRFRGAWRALIVALVALVALTGPPFAASVAGAETPTEVIEDLNGNIYVGRTRQAEFAEVDFTAAIEEAARQGHRLLIIAPDESVPSPEAFALRVRQAGEADITISFSEVGVIEASVAEEISGRELQALVAARAEATPAEAAAVYVDTLLTEPAREVPETIRQIVSAVLYLTIALGVVVLIELLIRQFRRRRHNKRRERARAQAAGRQRGRGDDAPSVDSTAGSARRDSKVRR